MKITALYDPQGVILAAAFQGSASGASGVSGYGNAEPVPEGDNKVATFDVSDDAETRQAAELAARKEACLTDAPGAYRRALLEANCLSHRVDLGTQRLVKC